jgi:hypothetical protein
MWGGKENEGRVPVGKPEAKVITRHEFEHITSAVTKINRFNPNVFLSSAVKKISIFSGAQILLR